MIHDDLICFRNKNPARNFGASGKEFAVFFYENCSYFVYKDRTFALCKKDATKDRELFSNSAKDPDGELYVIRLKDINWNILDFT